MFHKYQHVERLGTDEVEGIDNGVVYLFPKVDGTNGSVWLENGELHCGSRNRELTLDNDNQGFMQYIVNHKEDYLPFFEKYRNAVLFGEFLVKHTITWYRPDAYRKFYVFDVINGFDNGEPLYMHYEDYRPILNDLGITFVPVIFAVDCPSDDAYHKCCEENNYLIPDDEERKGEGIVVKRYGYKNKYGRTTWAKKVRGEFKESHRSISKTNKLETNYLERDITNKYVTDEFVLKEKAKLEGEWSNKRLGELFGRVFHELVTEESWHFVKENKFPKIDYSQLNRFTIMRVKEVLDI